MKCKGNHTLISSHIYVDDRGIVNFNVMFSPGNQTRLRGTDFNPLELCPITFTTVRDHECTCL